MMAFTAFPFGQEVSEKGFFFYILFLAFLPLYIYTKLEKNSRWKSREAKKRETKKKKETRVESERERLLVGNGP